MLTGSIARHLSSRLEGGTPSSQTLLPRMAGSLLREGHQQRLRWQPGGPLLPVPVLQAQQLPRTGFLRPRLALHPLHLRRGSSPLHSSLIC